MEIQTTFKARELFKLLGYNFAYQMSIATKDDVVVFENSDPNDTLYLQEFLESGEIGTYFYNFPKKCTLYKCEGPNNTIVFLCKDEFGISFYNEKENKSKLEFLNSEHYKKIDKLLWSYGIYLSTQP